MLLTVAGSRPSTPANTPSMIAASVTVRVIGPAVSWLAAIGTTPCLLINPTVGLIPTSEFALEGLKIEPEVSVPTVAAAKFAEATTPGPELEPPGPSACLPSLLGRGTGIGRGSYGSRTYPPSEL